MTNIYLSVPKWYKFFEAFVGLSKNPSRRISTVNKVLALMPKNRNKVYGSLVSEISDKLVKLANSEKGIVTIPKWSALVSKCKTALKKFWTSDEFGLEEVSFEGLGVTIDKFDSITITFRIEENHKRLHVHFVQGGKDAEMMLDEWGVLKGNHLPKIITKKVEEWLSNEDNKRNCEKIVNETLKSNGQKTIKIR